MENGRILLKFEGNKFLFGGGIFASVVYLSIPVLFGRGADIIQVLSSGDLNNLGDFLAGFFAPLAFLWLIIGLRIQAKELSLQRLELKASVDAMNQQVALSEERLSREKRADLPMLTLKSNGYMKGVEQVVRYRFVLENHGARALGVEIRIRDAEGEEFFARNYDSLDSDEPEDFEVPTEGDIRGSIIVNCESVQGQRQVWRWIVDNRGETRLVEPATITSEDPS